MLTLLINSCTKQNESNLSDPKKNNYEVVETLDISCNVDSDCETPGRYLIMSHCPYDSKCIKNKCSIICPEPFEGKKIEE